MVILNVPTMSCEGCAATIEKAVKTVDANAAVKADLAAKTVDIDTQADARRLSEAVKAAGYDNDVSRSA